MKVLLLSEQEVAKLLSIEEVMVVVENVFREKTLGFVQMPPKVYLNYGEAELLSQAYQNSLKLAVSKGLKTIAFPSISTGAYGYPIEDASEVALKTVKEFLEKENRLDEVVFVLFSEKALEVYMKKTYAL